MTAPLSPSSQSPALQPLSRWVLLALASFALNAILWGLFAWMSHVPRSAPAPLRVETLSPQQLEKIRKAWERRTQKKLLLQAQGKEAETPDPKARFESDRTVRVEREQRARQTDVTPTRSRSKGALKPRTPPAPPRTLAPNLSSLGVPMSFKAPPPKTQDVPAGDPDSVVSPGGAQSLSGEQNLPEGSENLLNTQESRFYSFYSRIYEAIGPLWKAEIQQVPRNRRLAPGIYRTVAEVILTPTGELDAVRILQSAGVSELDQVVISSWRKLARFPNPPKPLWAEHGKVIMNWSFEFQLTSGFQWVPGGTRRL